MRPDGRTREVVILRTIGAGARGIRRIFTTETIALALAGWLLPARRRAPLRLKKGADPDAGPVDHHQ
jgi:hypothetical protein